LPTAAAGPSQAPTAAVDNSAPRSTHPESTYKSGKAVQITGTTSISAFKNQRVRRADREYKATQSASAHYVIKNSLQQQRCARLTRSGYKKLAIRPEARLDHIASRLYRRSMPTKQSQPYRESLYISSAAGDCRVTLMEHLPIKGVSCLLTHRAHRQLGWTGDR
jgi:hypothetical protein